MEWEDEAIVLGARPHGEGGAVVSLLTKTQGRFAGFLSGSRRNAALLQPGTLVSAQWKARLVDHLGHLQLESLAAFPARWMDSPEPLAVIASAASMAELCLPERQSMEGVYAAFLALLSLEDASLFGPSYVVWEVGLLRALGYGLDLSRCALTGEEQGLAFVSPKTGRAVTAAAAKPYKEKLLKLPAFLTGSGAWEPQDLYDGLLLTGHFLGRHVLGSSYGTAEGHSLFPPSRDRLVDFYHNAA